MRLKGIYTVQTRWLARKQVIAGVSAIHVPDVIKICEEVFYIHVKHIPSACSIGCFVLEGGVGTEIQISNALSHAQGRSHNLLI